MDRNWNRGSNGNSNTTYGNRNYYGNSTSVEKIYRQSYRKKNDFSGQEYYSKIAKPVFTQPVKKEGLQVELIENELMDLNFSWIKNGGSQI